MPITIKPEVKFEDENIAIEHRDAELIKRIKYDMSSFDAIRVTCWLTKCRLTTAKNFVDKLEKLD